MQGTFQSLHVLTHIQIQAQSTDHKEINSLAQPLKELLAFIVFSTVMFSCCQFNDLLGQMKSKCNCTILRKECCLQLSSPSAAWQKHLIFDIPLVVQKSDHTIRKENKRRKQPITCFCPNYVPFPYWAFGKLSGL